MRLTDYNCRRRSARLHTAEVQSGRKRGKNKIRRKKTSRFVALPRSRGWAGGGKKRSPPRAPQRDPCSPRRVCDPGLTLEPRQEPRGQARGSVRLDEASPWGRLAPSATPPSKRNCPRNCSILPPISESVEIFARKKKKTKNRIVSSRARGSNQLELGQSDWLSGPEASQTRPTRRTRSSVSSDTGRRVKKVQPFLRNS